MNLSYTVEREGMRISGHVTAFDTRAAEHLLAAARMRAQRLRINYEGGCCVRYRTVLEAEAEVEAYEDMIEQAEAQKGGAAQ